MNDQEQSPQQQQPQHHQEDIDKLVYLLEKNNIKDDEKPAVDSSKFRRNDGETSKFDTGLVYDERMSYYKCTFPHPECPERILRIYQKLLDENLVERCKNITPRLATKDEILLKHSEDHYRLIASVGDKSQKMLDLIALTLDSIYLHPNVTKSALLSAGCTLELVEQVLKGHITNGAAVVRPPGHHALEGCSMGFCHFNNVALAAMMAIENYKLSRVLIVDWDVHYGNATHQMFNEDPRVFYFSLHRFDEGAFWPNLAEANFDAIGKGPGVGFNMHVAWKKGKIKDSSYLFAFDNLFIPVVKDYKPELILVSAGFDSGIGDPLGGCCVTPVGYAHMTKKLMECAGGRVAIVLEGGYNLSTISNSFAACVATLLGDDVPVFEPQENEQPCESSLESITDTFFTHLPFWKNALSPFENIFKELKNRFEEKKKLHDGMEKDFLVSSSSSDEDNPDYDKDFVSRHTRSNDQATVP